MRKESKYQKIKNLFGQFSQEYDAHMAETNHLSVQKKIFHSFEKYISGHVCDIACGTGTVGQIILSLNPATHLICADFQETMLEQAREKLEFSPHVRFLLSDVHQLPLLEEHFDTIVCCFGMYWFQDPAKVIKAMSQLLKPRGYFLVFEENFFSASHTQPLFGKRGGYLEELASLENYLGISKLKNLFDSATFSLKEESRKTIDNVHELVGLAFQKSGGK